MQDAGILSKILLLTSGISPSLVSLSLSLVSVVSCLEIESRSELSGWDFFCRKTLKLEYKHMSTIT